MDIIQINDIIEELINPTNIDKLNELQKVFLDLQKSKDYWHITDLLINNDQNDFNKKFYGVITLQLKVSKDLNQLSGTEIEELKYKLVTYINDSSITMTNTLLVNKLLSTLINLLLKMKSHDWLDLLFNDIRLNDLLKFNLIFEELNRIQLDVEMKSLLNNSLSNYNSFIEGLILHNLLADNDNVLDTSKNLFENYLKFNRSKELLLRLKDIILNNLNGINFIIYLNILQLMMNKLSLFNDIVTVINSDLFTTAFNQLDLINHLLNFLLAFSEHYSDDIINNLNKFEIQNFIKLSLSLTNYEGLPTIDEDISEPSLEIWFFLQQSISDNGVDDENFEIAKQIFTSLIYILLNKVSYPISNDTLITQSQSYTDQFLSYRSIIGDTFIYSYYILRENLLSLLVDTLSNQLSSSTPAQLIEATLFALKSIQEALPENEKIYTPQIFNQVFLTHILNLDLKVQSTYLVMIDVYSIQISQSPQLLSQLLQFIIPNLSNVNLSSYAANALRSLTYDCRYHLCHHLSQFGDLHSNLHISVPLQQRSKVIQSIVSVVQALPIDQLINPLLSITQPILSQIFNFLPAAILNQPVERENVLVAFDNLLAISKGLITYDDDIEIDDIENENEKLKLIESKKLIKEKTSLIIQNNESLIEIKRGILMIGNKLATDCPNDNDLNYVYGDIIKSLTISPNEESLLSPSLLDLLTVVGVSFTNSINSIWLSLASSLISRSKQLNNNGSYQYTSIITNLINVSWLKISNILHNDKDMHSHIDLTISYLNFLTMINKNYINSVVNLDENILSSIITFTSNGLLIPEKYGLKSSCDYFSSLISSLRTIDDERIQSNLENLLKNHGQNIINVCLYGVALNAPRSQVPLLGEIIFLFVVKIKSQSFGWIPITLNCDQFNVFGRATNNDRDKLIKVVNR